jgi:hypothetical protein
LVRTDELYQRTSEHRLQPLDEAEKARMRKKDEKEDRNARRGLLRDSGSDVFGSGA